MILVCLEKLRGKLPILKKQYGISSIGIFGSVARGDFHQHSDVDILVAFNRVPSLFKIVRLERELSKILRLRVDLVLDISLDPIFRQQIIEEMFPV